MFHRPQPPTSRLLLLPPEIRQQSWSLLLEVDTDDVECVEIRDLGPRLYTYADRLRAYMGFNPERLTVSLLQTSRSQMPLAGSTSVHAELPTNL